MIALNKTANTSQFYTWNNFRCAYEVYTPKNSAPDGIPLLLIHPIGVGLSRKFWYRFCDEWDKKGNHNLIYNPDLLGCGESDMPRIAYTPIDWAEQLQYFIQSVIQKPVILVVQGALFPVAIELVKKQPDLIAGIILSGPPAWSIMTKAAPEWQQKLLWNLLFDSPSGNLFYRYARRKKFLADFSVKQLFDSQEDVDDEWLDTLREGAKNPASRHAVFSFLAGFWRKDYQKDIESITQPTLAVFGETASSISQSGKKDSTEKRLADYQLHLPQGSAIAIPRRNVLPYESTVEFVEAITPFVNELGVNG
ncbi:alpha/beta hydrolase [Plectonema cf. radiosum LEGE 06105]|uniref:Alpha/beta hydrolase n=1 Tax=Plectonema cf. radiosum LEGE 06105 TaxID=945769 RepID=A0A8J7FG56_9CYAN|nr:alpha/beta hydrolase [Plectonema radiosum]MBE9216879.1 alpha/beta hydrolase [Plectonema cf. radiosum LEGE 06105]